MFSGIQSRWIRPRWDPKLHLAHPPSPADVEEMWDRYPEAAGCLIVSPTPYGTCADIAAIAKICHARGKPLIVDEAWGAHLPFHDDLPTWAMNAGADIYVVSVHEMGAGFEQGSVHHLQGDRVDPAHLSACADLLMTTSPNAILYSAIDGWRRQMVQHGSELLGNALALARTLHADIDALPGIHVLEDELLAVESSHDLDRMQILMDLSGPGISGYQAADWLRENCRIDMGLSDHRRIMATLSMADDVAASRLMDALGALIGAAPTIAPAAPVDLPAPHELELETVVLPWDAFFGPAEDIPTRDAIGRVAAEQITPYPPGIPAIVPGERTRLAYTGTTAQKGCVRTLRLLTGTATEIRPNRTHPRLLTKAPDVPDCTATWEQTRTAEMNPSPRNCARRTATGMTGPDPGTGVGWRHQDACGGRRLTSKALRMFVFPPAAIGCRRRSDTGTYAGHEGLERNLGNRA
nr:hypothetical protein [Arthrobacter sp. efr-133-TYG-120]